jgi:MORN variant repeat protein
MKKILKLLGIFVLLVFFVSCGENNEGPFETRKENGKLVLYSDNKLAKGWVEQTYTDFNSGITYKMSEIEYDKGLPTGKFKYYNGNGNLVFDADLKKKGDIYKGTVKIGVEQDNILKGEFNLNSDWIVTDKDTRIFSTSDIVLDFSKEALYNGSVDGPLLKLNKINGTVDGVFEKYYNNGQLEYKGTFKSGQLDGVFERYFSDGKLETRAEYKEGVLNGMYEGRQGYDNIKAKYKNGNYDGVYESYNNEKLIERIEYSDGIKNGVYERYDDSGDKIIQKGSYKNDLKDGVWEYFIYHGNGNIHTYSKINYKNDQVYGSGEEITYYENGKLWRKEQYNGEKLDGISEEYYENGKLFKKGKYKNGEKDGTWEGYDENGQLRGKSNYKNGQLDGIATLYNADGSFDQEIEYKDGVQVK